MGINNNGTCQLESEQLAVIRNSKVAVLQGFVHMKVYDYVYVQSGPEVLAVIQQMAIVQGWPLRGVPLYFQLVLQ